MLDKYSKRNKVVCIYDGKSNFDGKDILLFLKLGVSNNKKIGFLYDYTVVVPKYIEEWKELQNNSVCNNCVLSSTNTNTCYNNFYMFRSYNNWIEKYNKGEINYVDIFDKKQFLYLKKITRNRRLRFSISGDPLAVEKKYNERLMSLYNEQYILYSHFLFLDDWYKDKGILSVNRESEALLYQSLGYRTARIISDVENKESNETICTAQVDDTFSCSICNKCEGSEKSNIAFITHGASKKKLGELVTSSN